MGCERCVLAITEKAGACVSPDGPPSERAGRTRRFQYVYGNNAGSATLAGGGPQQRSCTPPPLVDHLPPCFAALNVLAYCVEYFNVLMDYHIIPVIKKCEYLILVPDSLTELARCFSLPMCGRSVPGRWILILVPTCFSWALSNHQNVVM